MHRLAFLPLLALLLAHPAYSQSADVIYVHARVWTGDSENPWADAFAVDGNRFLAVGREADVLETRGDGSRVVDLDGRFVTPGFIDNHVHFLSGGFQLAGVDLRSAASPEAFAERIAAFAESIEMGRWITGGDWDHELWGGELPRREWIDSHTRENPVFVSRLDGHMALANSVALNKAGITRETRDPAGGTIVRDPDTGEPTGVLKDEAMGLVYAVIPEPSAIELDESLRRAVQHAAGLGVTQVHDVGSFGGWADLEVYRRNRTDLAVRIYSFVPISTWRKLSDFTRGHGTGDDWLRWGALKGFVDGSLGSTTAWFYDPYQDAPETSGLMVSDTSALRHSILGAHRRGLHVAVHAIGDRANDWLLDVFADAQEALEDGGTQKTDESLPETSGPRFRIEHAQHLTEHAIGQFAKLGVIPSMQPYHAIDDGRWAEKRIGAERIKRTYAFRSLLDAGAYLSFGSDWTVAPLNPLLGIYAAVTRRTIDGKNPEGWVPEERISVEEALRAYTVSNAYAGHQEDRLGSIRPGFLADFVVLSDDLFAVDPNRIKDVYVLRTVVDGRDVFIRE